MKKLFGLIKKLDKTDLKNGFNNQEIGVYHEIGILVHQFLFGKQMMVKKQL